MANDTTPKRTTTPVKGGWVTRDTVSGSLREVRTSKGVDKASPRSGAAVAEASAKRSAALERLANR